MVCSMATSAVVVTSPITHRKSLVTAVSQATRAAGSWTRMASRIASETWSQTLSGWPSVTDSEVSGYEPALVNDVMAEESGHPGPGGDCTGCRRAEVPRPAGCGTADYPAT